MYAINHAATTLVIKKKFPVAPLPLLLLSVQLVEVLWVFFNYLGVEYFSVSNGKLHLDFLPWSHSVFSGLALAALFYAILYGIYRNHSIALAFSIGVMSHVIIDMLFHEQDIHLSPFSDRPVWGLGILKYPLLNFVLELLYGVFCWWYFEGSKRLLLIIIIFNILDLPIMVASGDALNPLAQHHFILPTFILFQILITWCFIYFAARVRPHPQHPRK